MLDPGDQSLTKHRFFGLYAAAIGLVSDTICNKRPVREHPARHCATRHAADFASVAEAGEGEFQHPAVTAIAGENVALGVGDDDVQP